MGEWVRYKLDQRTDHILVDEAQDTNAAQWDIVGALAEEFFGGSPRPSSRTRTLFMVGDFKQAIFGFQGTDPREFDQLREVPRRATSARERRRAATMKARPSSGIFRSTPASAPRQPVLDVVDAVIDDVGLAAMGLPDVPPRSRRAPFFAGLAPSSCGSPFPLDGSRGAEEGEEGWIDEPTRLMPTRSRAQVRDWIDEAPVLATTSGR